MSKWHKWRALPAGDRRLLAQAGLALIAARCLLPLIGFRAAASASDDLVASPASEIDAGRAQAVARLVGIAAAHLPFAAACLPRSLATSYLLRRIGIPCELRLGASTSREPFVAHAWVECAGVALGEDAASLARYRPFTRAVVPVYPWPGRQARVSA